MTTGLLYPKPTHRDVEIGGDGLLTSVSGKGSTPEEAIEDAWKQLTELPPKKRIVLKAMSDERSEVRWNGFMWMRVSG